MRSCAAHCSRPRDGVSPDPDRGGFRAEIEAEPGPLEGAVRDPGAEGGGRARRDGVGRPGGETHEEIGERQVQHVLGEDAPIGDTRLVDVEEVDALELELRALPEADRLEPRAVEEEVPDHHVD